LAPGARADAAIPATANADGGLHGGGRQWHAFLGPRCRPWAPTARWLSWRSVTWRSRCIRCRCWAWACQRGAAARAGDARAVNGHAVAALVQLDPILIFGLDLRPGRRDHRVGGPMALAVVRARRAGAPPHAVPAGREPPGPPTPAADGGRNAGDSDNLATPWRCLRDPFHHTVRPVGRGRRHGGPRQPCGLQRDLRSAAP
jgi:hypothetical protein